MTSSPEENGEVSAVTAEYKWVIENVSIDYKNIGDALKSRVFLSTRDGCVHNYNWQLYVYPRGDKKANKEYLSVHFYNRGNTQFSAFVMISLLNNNNEVVINDVTDKKMLRKDECLKLGRFANQDFIMNKGNNILNKGKLTILCKIILEEIKQVKTDEKQMAIDTLRLREFDELEHLISDQEISDVSFNVENKTIRAHKCILVKRSSVFTAMFRIEMKEKQDNSVQIKDMKLETFLEMLRFMYTGKVNGITKNAEELLAAADAYALDGLKVLCEETLCENLSTESVVENLQLAVRYRLDKLKAKAIKFIGLHKSYFIDNPEFKLLIELPEVLFEVCRLVMAND